jgi:predicted amidohydrolase
VVASASAAVQRSVSPVTLSNRTTDMKLCVAQTRPIQGDVSSNIEQHKKLIDLAVSHGATTVIFPELSLTGYEPKLARELATDADDCRFDDFQEMADAHEITIGVGVPTQNASGISITMVLFRPHQARQTYSKQYLHADEESYFVSGRSSIGLIGAKANIALAICYEISVPEHAEHAFKSGAGIYIASVAKSVSGVEKAVTTLSDIAKRYSMTVLMANCVGHCDDFNCGGRTSIWNHQGVLVGQLGDTSEGIIIIDTDTQELIEKTI